MSCAHVCSIVLLVACGTPRPEPLEHLAEKPSKANAPVEHLIRTPRPALDLARYLPTPDHELRWPLAPSSHPILEPGYDIAKELAEPGVSWLALCQRGLQYRTTSSANKDPIEYLRGWCAVLDRRVDEAVNRLVPLRSSLVHGIARAIRIDLANILVDAGDAEDAERRLAGHQLDDNDLRDVLAATFVELGKPDDARTINARAIEANPYASQATQCHRLARAIYLGNEGLLERLVDKRQTNDPSCLGLVHEVECWVEPAYRCGGYFLDMGIAVTATNLLEAYYRWPSVPTDVTTWAELARVASLAVPEPDADLFTIVALESAMRISWCDDTTTIEALRARAGKLIVRPELEPRRLGLSAHFDQLCRVVED